MLLIIRKINEKTSYHLLYIAIIRTVGQLYALFCCTSNYDLYL